MSKASRLKAILSIEDSDEDFYSLLMALKEAGVENPVHRCANSRAAARALSSPQGCVECDEAALILLDLNMPGVDGRELLELFRRTDTKKPVVILSTSAHPEDIAFCNGAGANDYVVKPLQYDRWRDIMAKLAASYLH